MTDYDRLAKVAMAKCCGYDVSFPQRSDVMIMAWAEALEDGGITEEVDVLMAVRVMYRLHGDPGWRPTPKVLVATAQECRNARLHRERQERAALEAGPSAEKITFAEFRKRHPDVQFPKFGKDVPDA